MATIRDVANYCGVSTATVSHVLNGRHNRVSSDTRTRVFAAVRELRYRPPALESNQKAILTRNIGLICPDLSEGAIFNNLYFARNLEGVLDACAKRGFSVTIFNERLWGDSGLSIRRSYDGRCDGVILLAPTADSPLPGSLNERGVNTVCIGSSLPGSGFPTVDVDNVGAATLVTEHLLSLGHGRLAYFGASFRTVSSMQRADGFFRACERSKSVESAHSYLATGFSAAERLFESSEFERNGETTLVPGYVPDLVRVAYSDLGNAPTAIVCWNDDFAESTIEALRDVGLRVPEDVSVAGFDDNSPQVGDLGLTTVRQDFGRIGRTAADILMDNIESGSLHGGETFIPVEFVPRESTAPVNKNVTAPQFTSATSGSVARKISNGGSH